MSTADEAEILSLLLSYARALDTKDWRGYAALYGPGAELVLPWGDPVPRARIAADTEQKLGGFAATHHMSTNQRIEVDGTHSDVPFLRAGHARRARRDSLGPRWLL
jgi:3-phenylpropionate/cinnamic acid dioxygenase small subunit